MVKEKTKIIGLISIILGLIGIILGTSFFLSFFGIIIALIGLILGTINNYINGWKEKTGIAGIILSLIGFIISYYYLFIFNFAP